MFGTAPGLTGYAERARGTGRIPADGAGHLTPLLADHQTIGGYPKVVAGVDIDQVAQRPVGAQIQFELVSQAKAITIIGEAVRDRELLQRIASRPDIGEYLRTVNLIDGVFDAAIWTDAR